MHITLLALGSRGDVQPYINLGVGLRSAGHRVKMVSFESFASLARENELDFHPIQGNAQALVASAGADMGRLVRSFGSLAAGYARDLSDPHLAETDLIINQLPGGLFGYDLAEKYGLEMVRAAVMPLARTSAFPVMGFPKLGLPGYNRGTHWLAEQMAWQMLRKAINRWRVQTLGLPPLPLQGPFVQIEARRTLILNGFSRHVVPRPADWGEHVHVTGAWFPEERFWQPPAALCEFLEAGSPPVFVGFGSMPLRDPQQATRIVLTALAQSGQRGILHSGWGGLGAGELPTSVFAIDSAPYEWLFPRMAMIVHHGGSGTTAFALRSGVPSCVVPFVFDQFYWGERVAALGAGPAPVPAKTLSAERLARAICAGTGSDAMRRSAAELGLKVRAENGVAEAVRVVEGKLAAISGQLSAIRAVNG